MAGIPGSGKIAHLTILEKYGEDFIRERGREGGKARHPNKGFGASKERARTAGSLGGKKSKRGKNK